jgi:tetratricopeptide (TPR) repeat protein
MNKELLQNTAPLLMLLLVFLFGCEAKYSIHEVVDINNQGAALQDTYILFLQDQIESDPKVIENYIKLTSIYKEQDRNEKALLLLQRASRETDQEISIMLELGKLYLEAGDVENLSVVLKSIRKQAEENMEFLKLSAGYALLRKDYTNAIFFANRAILINPYDDENIYMMASAKLINKDSLSAYQSFKEAYELKQSGKNFVKMYELSLALKKTNEAKHYLRDFEQTNKELDCCYFWGGYYNAIAQKDSARTILLNCSDSQFSGNSVKLELAKSYYPNDIDSVLYHLNNFLTKAPQNIPGIVLKAKALEQTGFYTESRQLYESAIKIDSTSTLALNGLNNLERKVAYLRLVKRKENVKRELDTFKPLNSKEIN